MGRYGRKKTQIMVARAHDQIEELREQLGSLDHLYFAFPQVMAEGSDTYSDPGAFIAAAIAAYRNPLNRELYTCVHARPFRVQ